MGLGWNDNFGANCFETLRFAGQLVVSLSVNVKGLLLGKGQQSGKNIIYTVVVWAGP